MPLTMAEYERRLRERMGLFDKPEPPPTASQTDPSLFQQFGSEAFNKVGQYLSAPGALGMAGAMIPRTLPQRPPEYLTSTRPFSSMTELRSQQPPNIGTSRPGWTLPGMREVEQLSGARPMPLNLPPGVRPTTADFNVARTRLPPDASLDDRMAAAIQAAQERIRLGPQPQSQEEIAAAARQRMVDESRRPYQPPPPFPQNQAPPPLSREEVDAILGPSIRQMTQDRFGSRAPEPPAAPLGAPRIAPPIDPPQPSPLDAPIGGLQNRLSRVSLPPQRQLPHEFPWNEIEKTPAGGGTEQWKMTYPGGGYLIGYADPAAKTFHVSSSGLPRAAQGGGAGMAGYEKLFAAAHDLDYTVFSDRMLSNKSFPVYDRALRDRGYDVVGPHPATRLLRDQGYTGGGYNELPSHRGEGIFQVGPKPPLEKDQPYWSLLDRIKMKAPKDEGAY